MKKLDIFVKRLSKIGVTLMLSGNYPWVYLDTVNGKKVTTRYMANHGFCVGFSPIRKGQEFTFTEIKIIFDEIRKHL